MDFQNRQSNSSKTDRERSARLLKRCRDLKTENHLLNSRCKHLKKQIDEHSRALKIANNNLDRIHSELEEELETARRIQEGLMPVELPEMINVKSAAVYIPAGKVGGDLYDIIITPRQKIAVLIFDVSGHGIPAALIGAMAKMLFAHYIEKTDSPSDVFREVNEQLCRFIKTEQYLTAFLGFIDPIKNSMTYSRAGHVPPMVYNSRSGTVTRLDSKGFFIGHSALLNLAEYWEQTVQLEPGDKLLFYTDGLTEGCSDENALYGGERLRDIFVKAGANDVQNVLDLIIADQTSFRNGAPLRDDFTLLCIEIENSEYLLTDSGFVADDEPNILLAYTYSDIERICSVILKEMDRCGFRDKSIKQFKLCVFEMMTNAILHGNRGDSKKKVIVFYKITPYSAAVSVMDQGNGFDPSSVPDPLSPENRMKDHGRGIFLIRHYLDNVEFNAKGNRILGRKYHNGK